MRVISGKARGTKLETLEGIHTRPTLDRVKEALFNILQNEMIEAEVLDLFSGSGALAIESISRGAKSAIACDNSKKAARVIEQNIQKTHFEKEIKLVIQDYRKCLQELKDKAFDIIFLDPPYDTNFGIDAIKTIIENKNLKEKGRIVFETDSKEYVKDAENFAKVIDLRKYGRVQLIFLGRKEQI